VLSLTLQVCGHDDGGSEAEVAGIGEVREAIVDTPFPTRPTITMEGGVRVENRYMCGLGAALGRLRRAESRGEPGARGGISGPGGGRAGLGCGWHTAC